MSLAADRVRAHNAKEVLRRIDDTTVANLELHAHASPADIAARLDRLDREWDTDRVLEIEAAAMGLVGLALGTLLRPQLLVLPGFVAASVLFHAITGRYPLMRLFRRVGFRTAREIARERYALKALRGDFAGIGESETALATPVPDQRSRAPQPEFH